MNAAQSNSTVAVKRGRKPSPDSLVFVTVGLTPAQWAWLRLWQSDPLAGGSLTHPLSFLFDRAMKFWPAGPFAFGHARKSGGAL